MNNETDNLIQLLQKGFHVTLGATASLIEVLQDPQKREESLSKLNLGLNELAQNLAEKGEVTEQESRDFVSTILTQRDHNQENEYSASSEDMNVSDVSTPEKKSGLQVELQELTAQIAAMRAELEKLPDVE